MPSDPSFTISYGELKAGKTADVLAAFPTAVYIAAPGALAPAEAVWGFQQPKARDLETFRDVEEFAVKDLKPGSAPALVIDDATLIADRTVNYLKLERKLDGFDLWAALFTQSVRMRDTLRRRGLHVVFTTHPLPAEMKNGVRLKGGPAFPGQTRMKLPAAADLLLRAEARAMMAGGLDLGWPYVYRTAPHPDWMQGSRFGSPDPCPMNLGEILRAAGYQKSVPRLPSLAWQEGIAETMAEALLGKLGDVAFVKAVIAAALEAGQKKSNLIEHAVWAVRDGLDRAILRANRAPARLYT